MIIGETKINVQRGDKNFFLDALVASNIDADVLAGIPFISFNDISIRLAKKDIILRDGTVYHYNSPSSTNNAHTMRHTHTGTTTDTACVNNDLDR